MRIRLLSGRAFPVRVHGQSMAPLLPAGALVAVIPVDAGTPIRSGDVVLARRPDRPDVEIIKRVERVLESGELIVRGDNPSQSTDSSHFGPIPRQAVIGRATWRYWPFPPRRLGAIS